MILWSYWWRIRFEWWSGFLIPKSQVLKDLVHYFSILYQREYASMAAVYQKDRTDFSTFLLRLTERELLDREKRAAERRVRDACFPVLKTPNTFDFKAQHSINEQLVRELMSGEFIDKKENVLLIGNPGTGKTHLVRALGFSPRKNRYRPISQGRILNYSIYIN